MFKVDDETCAKIKEVLNKQQDKPQNIRVYMAGMGWGGPNFGLGLDQLGENDLEEVINGINFIMEKDLFDAVGKVEVTWNGYGYSVYATGIGASNCG